MKKELKENCNLKDSDFGYHESDLYVVDTPEVRAYLKAHHEFWKSCSFFTCQVTGRRMIEIPFHNDAFWEKVARVTGAQS